MARFVLYSDDKELQKQLSSALGVTIILEHTESGVRQLIRSGACQCCILHLGAPAYSLQQRMASAERMIHDGIDLFIAADKGLEWSAVQIVRLGAKGYFHNDGEFRILKDLLLRANSSSLPAFDQGAPVESRPGFATDPGLIGASPQMKHVSDMIRLVANLDVPVFIHGETGTGKEVVARAIHRSGSRCEKPFVAVSCGAVPETLLESELFGHEKGAFTGTVGARQGNLEEAADGTIFFDEIGELSITAQVKLLRVLQECEFRRLGSNRLIPLRARLIFATHQDLETMVAQGTFRQDLYYRTNVVSIKVPPLRERPEDIPPLAAHFLKIYSRKFGLPMSEVDPDTLTLLQEYSWPGNIRELEHVIQSALILSRGETIRPFHVPERLAREFANVVDIDSRREGASFDEQLANFKLRLAQDAVRQNNGNKTLAARSLHISRPYLHRLLHLGDEEVFADACLGEAEAM